MAKASNGDVFIDLSTTTECSLKIFDELRIIGDSFEKIEQSYKRIINNGGIYGNTAKNTMTTAKDTAKKYKQQSRQRAGGLKNKLVEDIQVIENKLSEK